jgi:hypothetical protein
MKLEQVLEDIKNTEDKLTRVANPKAQCFGNDYVNIFFLKSGYVDEKETNFYYVLIENDKNPIPPTLMTPGEIKEKLNIIIDDYY